MRMLGAVEPRSGLAFVVLQHLDPTHASHSVELIGHRTRLTVVPAEDGSLLAPDTVYVLPPNRFLSVKENRLQLTPPADSQGVRLPVDHFLRDLAGQWREKAVAIILSGTGRDGTLGLRAIKAAGGLAVAQDPETAAHGGMPRSAIATGLVDWVVAPERMPVLLRDYLSRPYVRSEPHADAAIQKSDEDALAAIITLMRTRTRGDFRGYKRNTLARRAARRMCLHQLDSLHQYLALLRTRPDELGALVRDMLISVTAFFREPEAWAALEETVIKPLVAAAEPEQALRFWVAGCATGEEAYSLVMMVMDQLQQTGKQCPLRVFASDIDHDALEVARAGRYPLSISADLAPRWLERYFTRTDRAYVVDPRVRETVTFAEQNLISDPPFSKVDLICCRNVLIYLEPELQARLLGVFHFALNEGGCLFLGSAETIGKQSRLFRTLSPKRRLYRRIGPVPSERTRSVVIDQSPPREMVLTTPQVRREVRLARLAEQRLVQRFAPGSVLIGQDFEILHFCGATETWLSQPSGPPTVNLLSRAREGLRGKLRATAKEAFTTQRTVVVQAHVRQDRALVPCTITVMPVQDLAERESLLLIAVEPHAATVDPSPDASAPTPLAEPQKTAQAMNDAALIQHLEREIEVLREDLNGSLEQLVTSNEELKSA
ncbi:MAG: hypothetical protein KC620_16155, partial [Myxococcales bacterium]|nr:hypothetical protein [Myxococcales bacterium]